MVDDIEAIIEVGSAAAVEIAASALAERGAKTGACANCASPLLGPYCAVCGQPADTHRRSVRVLLHDFVLDLVNFDSRILRTVRALLFQPGELPSAFRRGRMQRYVPAIRLYFFVSLIFFVMLSAANIAILQLELHATPVKIFWDAKGNPFIANPQYDRAEDSDPELRKLIKPLIPISKEKATRPGGYFEFPVKTKFFSHIGTLHSNLPPAAQKQLLESSPVTIELPDKATASWLQSNIYGAIKKISEDPAALNAPLTNWIPRILFLLLPLYALLLALFHIRRLNDYYLVDHLVFSLSVHTFAFVGMIVAVVLAQFVSGGILAAMLFGVISLYIFLAMKRFYEQGWIITSVKFLFVSGIYTIFFLLPAMVGVLLLSFLGGAVG